MTFRHTIMLWCSRWHEFVKLFHFVLIEDQTRNSNICLRDQIIETFSFLVTMIFHFTLKLFELFKCFRLMFHQVDIPISAQIICEGQKITVPAACLNTHRTADIDMFISNKVRLQRLDTPLRCAVPSGVSCETIPHCFK